MKKSVTLHFGKLSVDAGWFPGEPFCLFKTAVGEVYDLWDGRCVVLFEIQVLRLAFSVMYDMAGN